MATTYTLINSTTLTGSQASVSFTSLSSYSSIYTDLILRISARSDRTNPDYRMWLKINGSTANYATWMTYNAGGTPSGTGPYGADSYGVPSAYGIPNTGQSTSNTFSNIDIYFTNAFSSNYKSYTTDGTGENNGTGIGQALLSGLWSDTSAINSLEVSNNTGLNWLTGSSFYLYGIKKN